MDVEKLAKVLAMLDSSTDGEAMAAMRAARQMLKREGLTFQDIAYATRSRESGSGRSGLSSNFANNFFAATNPEILQGQVRNLKAELGELQQRFNEQLTHTHRWQVRVDELQRVLERQEATTQRLRQKMRPVLQELRDLKRLLDTARPPQTP